MGAFDYGYYKVGMVGDGGGRKSMAIAAIKRELAWLGFGTGIDMSVDKFGGAVDAAVKMFQASVGLKADGVCGPTTLKEMYRPMVEGVELEHGLTRGDLVKQLYLESGYDPVAVGSVDPEDKGIAQIHLPFFPNITLENAYDPVFSIAWSGMYISSQVDAVAGRANVYKAGRAAYNVGTFYATEWMKDGFPEFGYVVNGVDWYKRATDYLAAIDRQAP